MNQDEMKIAGMAAQIVAAYVSRNLVPFGEIPELTRSIHATLVGLSNGGGGTVADGELRPAVPVKKSITDEWIVCLEDGKKFKSLKRHLKSAFGLSPEDYRRKWGLPSDYPMVAPAYSARRSGLAKQMGLGRPEGAGKGRRGRKPKPKPS
jgi:predicted transcriptional regulator